MSLAAGPGRGGGGAQGRLPNETKLVVEKHVVYIQSLDTVRADIYSPELALTPTAA